MKGRLPCRRHITSCCGFFTFRNILVFGSCALQHKLKCITSHKMDVVQTNILQFSHARCSPVVHIEKDATRTFNGIQQNLFALGSNRGRSARGEGRCDGLTFHFVLFFILFICFLFCSWYHITQSQCMGQLGGCITSSSMDVNESVTDAWVTFLVCQMCVCGAHCSVISFHTISFFFCVANGV